MHCSIIIPVLNEAAAIGDVLSHLQGLRQTGHELIVVDGGSKDDTRQRAGPQADRLLQSPAGRARQMNTGAHAAHGKVLVFLHADTLLPDSAMLDIEQAVIAEGRSWGYFSVRLSGKQPMFRLIERMMNMRSCLTGIATGDQVMFIRREVFESSGGFDEIPIMEDIAMSKKLKTYGPPACLRTKVCTSSRRWERHGILRTVFLMWSLRLRYWLGASPDVLVRRYYKTPS